MNKHLIAPAALLSLVCFVSPAVAQWAPERPVTLILANNAGGGADFIARLVADKASEIWGQPVVVENHGGAASRIGTQLAIRAPNDGYTVFMGQNTLAIWPAIYTNMPFDTFNDLDAVTQITEIPLVFTAYPGIPVENLTDLIDYAREHPGELNYAGLGVGSISHMLYSLVQSLGGVTLTNIPYPGTAQSVAALMSGEVQADLGALTLVQGAIDAGTLKALAVVSSGRLPTLPDTPTVAELGYPELEAVGWNGIFLPAGASEEILDAYQAVFHQVMEDPGVIAAVQSQGQIVKVSESREAFQDYIDSQVELYLNMGEIAGIEKQDAQR